MYSNTGETPIKVDEYISEASSEELIISKFFRIDFWTVLSVILYTLVFMLAASYSKKKILNPKYSTNKQVVLFFLSNEVKINATTIYLGALA